MKARSKGVFSGEAAILRRDSTKAEGRRGARFRDRRGECAEVVQRHRSMLAALLRMPSSAIHQPALTDSFQDLAPFLVEPGVV
jgi:hypothetical protein